MNDPSAFAVIIGITFVYVFLTLFAGISILFVGDKIDDIFDGIIGLIISLAYIAFIIVLIFVSWFFYLNGTVFKLLGL